MFSTWLRLAAVVYRDVIHIRLLPLLCACVALFVSACGGGRSTSPDLVFSPYAGRGLCDLCDERRTAAAEAPHESGERRIDSAGSLPDRPSVVAWGRFGAFASKRKGTFDVYVMHADGSGARALASTRADGRTSHVVAGSQPDRVRARRRHLRHASNSAPPGLDLQRVGRQAATTSRRPDRNSIASVDATRGRLSARSGSCGQMVPGRVGNLAAQQEHRPAGVVGRTTRGSCSRRGASSAGLFSLY